MKRRGRAPAPTDRAAVMARKEVENYLSRTGLNVAQLARQTGCSVPAIWRVLKLKTPVWSPTLKKLNEFLKNQQADQASGDEGLVARLADAARGVREPSLATAKLLRLVADLLDGGAKGESSPAKR